MNNEKLTTIPSDVFTEIRRHRLIQICGAIAFGLFVTLLVSRGITSTIVCAGLGCLLFALVLAYKHQIQPSAFILLGSMSAMLFAMALTGAGLFDLAILGYPCMLIFAAILGGVGLFFSVLLFVIVLCVILGWLALQTVISPNIPILSWPHLVIILVILNVTGFSVFILVRDIKRLTWSLQQENAKVIKSRTEIQHLAHHDPLTQLPNRLYGEELFVQTLSDCKEQNLDLALLFIDLDNFKPVNDALGHAAGDELLQQLSQRLKSILRAGQHLIRFGGDEFLVLSPYSGQRQFLDDLAEALIRESASIFNILRTDVVVSASIGIACAPEEGTDFKQLCRKADIAMYQAKHDGRNTYHYYNESLDQVSDDKFKLLQKMRPALENREFELYFQPLVDLSSNQINTVEALIRWPQPDGSIISPEQFIPVAESSGLISELGCWVINQACLYCAQQRQTGLSDLCVSVNLSVVQFKDGQLQKVIETALERTNLPASALELELTESLLIDQTDQIQKQLNDLNSLGCSIAIDDFGTGYSNLRYLRDFNASKLKIDRSFIQRLNQSHNDQSLVKAIIDMAQNLGLKTVAEGIEDEATLIKLRSMGCDIGQGYYWSKPLPNDEIRAFLHQHK